MTANRIAHCWRRSILGMERTGGIGIRTAESAFRCIGFDGRNRRSNAVARQVPMRRLARVRMRTILTSLLAGLCAAIPAEAEAATLDGSSLGIGWMLPFVGILLSIAVLPQLNPHFWDRHLGKLSLFW